MSEKNEFDDDPPTVVERPREVKLDFSKPVLRLNPYESINARVTLWAVKYGHWLEESPAIALGLAVTFLMWLATQTIR